MDLEALKKTYYEFVNTQNERLGFVGNKFYAKMAESIFNATERALDPNISDMHIIAAQTGSGKSTYMEAMASALYKNDLSCAIMTKTINQVHVTYENIARLLDIPTGEDYDQRVIDELGPQAVSPKVLVPYSAIHKEGSTAFLANQKFKLGKVERFDRHDKTIAPIVISTHAALLLEMEIDDDTGILKHNDEQRNVVFIDESPDFVVSGIMSKGNIELLKDELSQAKFKTEYDTLTALQNDFQAAIDDKTNTSSGQYTADVNLFNEEIDKVFLEKHNNYYLERGNLSIMEHMDRKGKKQQYADFIKFLKALKFGDSHISKNKGQIIYTQNLFKNEPSFIMLDATASIENFHKLHKLSSDSVIPCPNVSYEYLQLYHLVPPKKYSGSKTANKSSSYIVSYKKYILDLIIRYSEPDEEILLIARKSVVDRIHKEELINAYRHFKLEDRIVHVIYYGSFIGENEWGHIKKVFLFTGYQRPQDIYIGLEGTYSGGITDELLKSNSGGNLVNLAKELRENESLKWFKQLAARGNIRKLDSEGRAGQMKLYTDTELLWLIKNQRRAFPYSPIINFIPTKNDGKDKAKNKIVRYLANNLTGICDYNDIADAGGFKDRSQIARALKKPEVMEALKYLGWNIINKRDVPEFEGQGLKRLINYSYYNATVLLTI